MVDLIDAEKGISIHSIQNWILLLAIFSLITSIGNYAGYEHPISDSLMGMIILSFIALLGILMERRLPLGIPAIVYIAVIGAVIVFPLMPTSPFVSYYVSQIELISIVTVFLAYLGIEMSRGYDLKHQRWRVIAVTVLVILSAYLGSAIIDHVILLI